MEQDRKPSRPRVIKDGAQVEMKLRWEKTGLMEHMAHIWDEVVSGSEHESLMHRERGLVAALTELYEAVCAVTPARVLDAHPDAPEDVRLLAALLAAERALGIDGELD